MSKNNITDIFNRFVGKEVPMEELDHQFRIGGRLRDVTITKIRNPNDPVIKEIRQVAAENGLSLRVLFPGSVATRDYRTDRLNAYIAKEKNGKWRISNRFIIG